MLLTINVSVENAEFVKKTMKGQISSTINEFLDTLRLRETGNIEGINIEIEKMTLKKLESKLSFIQAEIKTHRVRIDKYTQLSEEKKMQELEEEKARIEREENCINCGHTILTEFKTFDKGKVCQACFLKMSAADLKRWN